MKREDIAKILDRLAKEDFDDNDKSIVHKDICKLFSNWEQEKQELVKEQKANIEKHMAYLFRQLPEWFIQKPRYMSERRKNSLWGNMCMWTDKYLESIQKKEQSR